jgi:hypothetical protein
MRRGMHNSPEPKVMAAVVIVLYLIFATAILALWFTFLPEMESAGEETRDLISGDDVGSISIINDNFIPEIRLVFIICLFVFGISDGTLVFLLWRGKPPFRNQQILSPLITFYCLKRGIGTPVIIQLSILTIIMDNSRTFINSLYAASITISVIGLVIIIIVYTKVLKGKMVEEVVFKVPG